MNGRNPSDTVGISAFARSDWLSKSDRIGQGYTMFTPTSDLFAEMKRRQEFFSLCKEAASLLNLNVSSTSHCNYQITSRQLASQSNHL